MDIKIFPNKIKGEVKAIASKSYAQRALIASSLCETETKIYMNKISDDILNTIAAIKDIGTLVDIKENCYTIIPKKKGKNQAVVNCGESATTARIMLPVCAALYDSAIITGDKSLKKRPFNDLCNAMKKNGCNFKSSNIPVRFTSKMKPGNYKVDTSKSSQYLSGLLFALPILNNDSTINTVSSICSNGYIDITKDVLHMFDIKINGNKIAGNQKYISPKCIKIEGDYTSASVWQCAGINVRGLNENSLQKDKLFQDIKQKNVIDATDIPDLVPTLVTNAIINNKEITINNVSRLKYKESNRLISIKEMVESLGGKINVLENSIKVFKSRPLKGGIVDSFNDHRIVMCATILSCYCENEVTIKNAHSINKSYKEFFSDFTKLGGKYSVL